MMTAGVGCRRTARRRRNLAPPAAILVHLLLATTRTYGQPLELVRYAPDITVSLGAGTVVGAGVLATDDLSGGVAIVGIANLPAAARIAAAHRLSNGDFLLAFDSTIALPGAGTVEPRDLVQFASATQTYSVAVRGADVGIPSAARIDAVATSGDGTILLSLDTSVGAFDDEDVIRIDASSLALFLDLSAVGIAESLDLDGLDVEEGATTRLYVSFDGSGTVDAVAFDDEDILVYDLSTHTWALAYDGSAAAAGWPDAADLIALDVALPAPPAATPTKTLALTDTPTATTTLTPTPPVGTGTTTPTATLSPTLPVATATGTATVPVVTSTATATATGPAATETLTTTATVSPTGPAPTATATATASVAATSAATATASATVTVGISCPGDCNGSGEVTIDELILLVNIALDALPVSSCRAGDLDNNDAIAINELVTAVNSALGGCPG